MIAREVVPLSPWWSIVAESGAVRLYCRDQAEPVQPRDLVRVGADTVISAREFVCALDALKGHRLPADHRAMVRAWLMQ